MKKFLCLALAITMLLFVFSGCSSETSSQATEAPASEQTSEASADGASAESVTIRFACDDTQSSTYYMGLEKFKEVAEAESGGSITVELYSDGILGTAADTIEGMQYGTLEAAFAGTSPLTGFVPEFAAIDAPFLFRDTEHAMAVVDGEIGQWLSDLTLERTGIRIMGYMDSGFRHLFTTEPVETLEDFEGVKVRTMNSEVHVATFDTLGALATPMASSEIFTGLQQNTIDGAENAYSYILNQKLYEAAPYVTSTGHFYGICVIMMADEFYQSLSDEHKAVVDTAAAEAISHQRELIIQQNEDAKAELMELGVEIIEIDRSVLEDAVQSVYVDFSDIIPADIVEDIKSY